MWRLRFQCLVLHGFHVLVFVCFFSSIQTVVQRLSFPCLLADGWGWTQGPSLVSGQLSAVTTQPCPLHTGLSLRLVPSRADPRLVTPRSEPKSRQRGIWWENTGTHQSGNTHPGPGGPGPGV